MVICRHDTWHPIYRKCMVCGRAALRGERRTIHPGQRPIRLLHVARLVRAINTGSLLEVEIETDRRGRITNGQHRYIAATLAKRDVPIVVRNRWYSPARWVRLAVCTYRERHADHVDLGRSILARWFGCPRCKHCGRVELSNRAARERGWLQIHGVWWCNWSFAAPVQRVRGG